MTNENREPQSVWGLVVVLVVALIPLADLEDCWISGGQAIGKMNIINNSTQHHIQKVSNFGYK
jgi:hypothetical protein